MMLKLAYHFIGTFLITLFCLPPLLAQAEVNYYGLLDGKFPVRMNWENEGKSVFGQLYFGSLDSLKLQGKSNNQKINLTEKSTDDNALGNWEIEKKPGGFVGYWNGENLSQNILLYPKVVTPNFIFKKIKSNVTNADWELIIQSISAEKMSGVLFSATNNQYYQLIGGWDNKGGISLKVIDDAKKGQVWMANKDASTLVVQWEGEHAQILDIQTQDYFIPEPKMINNKVAQIYFIYPQLNHFYFDRWLTERIEPLWTRAQVYEQRVRIGKFHKGLRGRVRAEFSCTINMLNEKYVGGTLKYWDSWSAKQIEETFVFDLERALPLAREDLLKNETAFAGFVKNKMIAKYIAEPDQSRKDWLQTAAIDQWELRPDGIWWSTDFHPIFGQAGILLDQQSMAPFLKRESPLGK